MIIKILDNVNNMAAMFYGSQAATIYVSDLWNTRNIGKDKMFREAHVVGQNGTTITNNPLDKTYARIDNAPDSPGYFTYKAAPTNISITP